MVWKLGVKKRCPRLFNPMSRLMERIELVPGKCAGEAGQPFLVRDMRRSHAGRGLLKRSWVQPLHITSGEGEPQGGPSAQ